MSYLRNYSHFYTLLRIDRRPNISCYAPLTLGLLCTTTSREKENVPVCIAFDAIMSSTEDRKMNLGSGKQLRQEVGGGDQPCGKQGVWD